MQTLKAKALVDNRFEIIELLGSGGMGMVYKAKQLELDRTVALKFLLPHLYEDELTLARFKTEAEALSTLSHRNIILFYAYGVWHGRAPYIAMEYLQAPSLADALAAGGGKITWRRTLQICQQICDGIAHAHANGIIHRDLKPTNIFVLEEERPERVKISDFGLAKIMDDSGEQKLTATGYTVGSPHYMSPEQAQAKQVTFAADIYSTGCIMYQCLFGRPPFDADTPVHVIFQHANTPCPLPDPKHCKDIPTGIIAIMERALAKKPDDRFASMADMAAVLAELVTSTADQLDCKSGFILGTSTPTTAPPAKLPQGFRMLIGSGIALVLLLTCLNWQNLTMLSQDLRLRLAPNTYEAAKVEIAQFQLYHKLNLPDREEATLEHLSRDLRAAMASKEFTSEEPAARNRFVVSAVVALMQWHPKGSDNTSSLSGCLELCANLDGEVSQLVNTLLLSLMPPGKHMSYGYKLQTMTSALTILQNGPYATYRREEIELLKRAIGQDQASLQPPQMMAHAEKVERAAQQHKFEEAIDWLLPVYFSYCLNDQSAEARLALTRAMESIETTGGIAEPVSYHAKLVRTCYRALLPYYGYIGDNESIEFLRKAINVMQVPQDDVQVRVSELARLHLLLGDALRLRGKFEEASQAYQQAMEVDSKTAEKRSGVSACSMLSQADMLCRQSKWKEARALYHKVASSDIDTDREFHVTQARTQAAIPSLRLGELDAEITRYNKLNGEIASEINHLPSTSAPANFYKEIQLGNMFFWLKDYDQALVHFQQADTFSDGNYDAAAGNLRKARLFVQQNDPEQAIEFYKQAIARTPPPPEHDSHFYADEILSWRAELGTVLNRFGKREEAKQVLLNALPLNDKRWTDQTAVVVREMARELSYIYAAEERTDLALKYLNKAVEADARSGHMRNRLWPDESVDRGYIAALQKNDEEAEMQFRIALMLMDDCHHRDYPRVMAALAKIRLRQGNRAEAKRLLAASLERWEQYLKNCMRDWQSVDYRDAVALKID